MTCEELTALLPDLLDETLTSPILEEAQAALKACPECQRELKLITKVRNLLLEYRNNNEPNELNIDIIKRVLASIRCLKNNKELVDPYIFTSLEAMYLWLKRFE